MNHTAQILNVAKTEYQNGMAYPLDAIKKVAVSQNWRLGSFPSAMRTFKKVHRSERPAHRNDVVYCFDRAIDMVIDKVL